MSELRNVHTTSVHIFDARDTLLKIKEDYELQLTLLLNAEHSPSYDPKFHKLLRDLAEYSRIAARPPEPAVKTRAKTIRYYIQTII